MLGVVTLTFFVSRVLAGDPTDLYVPPQADEAFRETIRAQLGLDKPLAEQYALFLRGAVTGDLGTSATSGRPVTSDLFDRLPATIELALYALVISVVLGIVLGVVAAVYRDRLPDFGVRGVSLIGMSLPSFWLGLVLIFLFFVTWSVLPGPVGRLPIGTAGPERITGLYTVDSLLRGDLDLWWQSVRHLILPVVTLSMVSVAPIARVTRAEMVEALGSEYTRTSIANGLGQRTINFRYALRNALLPVITMVGGVIGFLLSGAVLVEAVFGWPGIGQYALDAIARSDFAALQGFVLWSALLYVATFLVVDLLYLAADPRTR
jgi:peptide/nickel transport system permease protein